MCSAPSKSPRRFFFILVSFSLRPLSLYYLSVFRYLHFHPLEVSFLFVFVAHFRSGERSPDLPTRHSRGRRVVVFAGRQISPPGVKRRSLLRHNPPDRFDPFLGLFPRSYHRRFAFPRPNTSSIWSCVLFFYRTAKVDAHAAVPPLGLPLSALLLSEVWYCERFPCGTEWAPIYLRTCFTSMLFSSRA